MSQSVLESRHILVFSIYYWPETTGIAPYSTGLAEHLAKCGARVTVISGMPHYPHWRIHPEYRRRFRVTEGQAGVTIKRSRIYVPSQQTAVRRAMYEATYLSQCITTLVTRPDGIISIVPNLGGGLAGAIRARKAKIPLGVLMQDLTGAGVRESGIRGGGNAFVEKSTVNLERFILRRADRVAIVSQGFRSHVVNAGVPEDKIDFLPNWARHTISDIDRDTARANLGWPIDRRIILHTGNMGLKQGLENIISAASLAHSRDRDDLLFVFLGEGNQKSRLVSMAGGMTNVMFHPPVGESLYQSALRAADLLLISERPSVRDMSLPSKLTSYFRASRPIIASVRPDGATGQELLSSGAGYVVEAGNAAELLEALDSVFTQRPLQEKLISAALRYSSNHLSQELAHRRIEHFASKLLMPRGSENVVP